MQTDMETAMLGFRKKFLPHSITVLLNEIYVCLLLVSMFKQTYDFIFRLHGCNNGKLKQYFRFEVILKIKTN